MSDDITLDVHAGVATLPESRWNDLVARAPGGSVFHRTEWLRAVERGTDLTPRHVVAARDGTLVGALPNVVNEVDLPVSVPEGAGALAPRELVSVEPGFGGPIVAGDYRPVLDRLIEGVRAAATDDVWVHRIRTLDPASVRYADHLDARGYDAQVTTCQLLLDLGRPTDDVFADWDKERRREARRAREEGLTATRVTDPTRRTMDEFYDAYAAMIDRVDGLRYPPEFIHALADCLGERLVLFRADLDGETVGWHLYVRDDEQDSLHHFFSGLREEHFRYHPSSFLHHEAIEWASSEGFGTYNFGESNADADDGGFGYKSQYGGEVEPVLTWEKGLARARWGALRVARRLYRTHRANA